MTHRVLAIPTQPTHGASPLSRSERQAFGIKADDRRRHIAIVGKTGMGKSTLLERLIISDMQAGRGVGLVDPHGDLADAVLAVGPQPMRAIARFG